MEIPRKALEAVIGGAQEGHDAPPDRILIRPGNQGVWSVQVWQKAERDAEGVLVQTSIATE